MDSFELASVDAFKALLKNNGWYKKSGFNEYAEIWASNSGVEVPNIMLPTDVTLSDFQRIFKNALREFSEVEGVQYDYLVERINRTQFEKVSFRVVGDSVSDGSIKLLDGITLNEKVREFLTAIARSVDKPKRYFTGGSLSSRYESFIENAKLEQTEIGSYIVNISLPKSVDVNESLPLDTSSNQLPKYSEKFLSTIESSLKSILGAITRHDEYDSSDWDAVVRDGVSANLCDALYGMTGRNRELDVEVSIKRVADPIEKDGISIKIKKDQFVAVKEIAERLKGSYVLKGEVVESEVEALDHKTDGDMPYIKLTKKIGGEKRPVKINVTEEQYWLAVDALANRRTIICQGDIEVRPKSAEVIQIVSFKQSNIQSELNFTKPK